MISAEYIGYIFINSEYLKNFEKVLRYTDQELWQIRFL